MEKLNIAEILKDCPKGMELDCTMYDDVTFVSVDDKKDTPYPIKVLIENGASVALTKYGQYTNANFAKCVIFPKGKTSWEGFQRPFKDGDILFVKSAYNWIFIYKESENNENLYKYAAMLGSSHSRIIYDIFPLCCKEDVSEIRFATEEEEEKLFKAIKDNGYRWNTETKTLEKLPKFKVGDRVKHISAHRSGIVVKVVDKGYYINYPKGEGVCFISFMLEKDYELTPNKFDITTLKPFDKVLVRTKGYHNTWICAFFSYKTDYEYSPYWTTADKCYQQCIPYKGNEHLLGTTNECDDYYKTW